MSTTIAGTFSVYRNTVNQTVAPTPELQVQVNAAVIKMRNVMTRVTTVSMSTTFFDAASGQRYKVVYYPNVDA
jgi:hypothetical protein